MGLFSSKSSSSTKQYSTNYAIDGAEQSVAGIDTGKGGVTNLTIYDASQEAADIAKSAIGLSEDTLKIGQDVISANSDVVTGLFNFLDNSQNRAVEAVADTAATATQSLADTRAPDTAIAKNIVTYGVLSATVLAAVYFWRK